MIGRKAEKEEAKRRCVVGCFSRGTRQDNHEHCAMSQRQVSLAQHNLHCAATIFIQVFIITQHTSIESGKASVSLRPQDMTV